MPNASILLRGVILSGLIILNVSMAASTTAIAGPTAIAAVLADESSAESSTEKDVEHQLELFRSTQVPLRQAMRTAEALHPGSRTTDISFEGKDDALVYRVKTVKDRNMWENSIDARSGSVTGEEVASFLNVLAYDDQLNVATLQGIRQNMSDAVTIAEKSTAGKAISGNLVNDKGKFHFVIVTVVGDDLKQVVLEPPGANLRKPPPPHSR
ncbi:PepSY domain-containing protein [Bradyrhizobium cenepequi]